MMVYVASSWRNEYQPLAVRYLRNRGHDVYDFRHPSESVSGETIPGGFHWSEIDEDWKNWNVEEYREHLSSPPAELGFARDMTALNAAVATGDVCRLSGAELFQDLTTGVRNYHVEGKGRGKGDCRGESLEPMSDQRRLEEMIETAKDQEDVFRELSAWTPGRGCNGCSCRQVLQETGGRTNGA